MWKTIGQNYDGPALRGVRFLLAALTVGSSLGLIARFKRHFIAVERVIGVSWFGPVSRSLASRVKAVNGGWAFPLLYADPTFRGGCRSDAIAPERTPLPAVAKLQIGSSYPVVGVDALREDAELFERRCV